MADPLVRCEVDEKVSIITLNRPDKLNAISHELQHALTEAFGRADADPATSVVLLRAEGRSFCAGYDIGAKGPDGDDWRSDPTKAHAHLQPQLEFEMAPWLMRKPVIASVQGHVLGGGCELVMLCDLTIAADNATFGEPEVRFSAVGPAIVMPMIIGYKKARELLYFGDQIDAPTALGLGMINRIVPLAELRAASLGYAKRLSLISPEALYATKRAVNRVADAAGFRTALYAGLDVVGPLYATTTEAGARFREIARSEGVPAAVRWRSGQFGPRLSNVLTLPAEPSTTGEMANRSIRRRGRQRHTPDAPVMVVGEDQRAQRPDAEATCNEAHECRLMKLPIGPDHEAPCRAIIEHSAAWPFLVFRPDRRRRKTGVAQRLDAPTRKDRPVLEMPRVHCEHVAIGFSLLQRNGQGDHERTPAFLDHPERADHARVDWRISHPVSQLSRIRARCTSTMASVSRWQ